MLKRGDVVVYRNVEWPAGDGSLAICVEDETDQITCRDTQRGCKVRWIMGTLTSYREYEPVFNVSLLERIGHIENFDLLEK